MTGSANYWYVPTTSPIKAVKDIDRRTIAYSKNGASSQYDVFDFMDRYRFKARPVLTAGEAAALDQVTLGRIDVGWAKPPFAVHELEHDRIRIVAKANDIPKIRDKTVSVMIANAETLEKRKDVLTRFVQGYRETLDWMYSDPAAPKAYAVLTGISEGVARRLRDDFFAKEMLSPDKITGLKVIMKEAKIRLSRRQIIELVQIPPPARNGSIGSPSWRRLFSH